MKRHVVLRIVAKLLIPYILLFALYVQFHGDFGPGGGFQAGVMFSVPFILYGLIFGLDAGYAVYGVGLALIGIGFGLMQASLQSAIVESAPPGLAASAVGIYQLTRQLGSVVGAALFAAIVGSTTAGSDIGDYRTLYTVLAGAGVAGTLLALAIHTWPPRPTSSPP